MSDEEEYIAQNDVAEIVPESEDPAQAPSDDEGDIEIDLSNNSSAYFDAHEDSVYLIATHPTLPLVVSGGGDNLAYIWTTHSSPPKLAAKLEGHTESVVAGGFTADGRWLVTGDMSGQVRVWRSHAGGEKWELSTVFTEVEEVVWIALHPKRSVFAVGASDGSVWVYEAADSTEFSNVAVLYAHSLPTTGAVFPPPPLTPGAEADNDALQIITVSEDAQIICWNVYTSSALYTLGPLELRGEHPWVSVCLSPTGKTFAAGSQDGLLAIVKSDTGALLQQIDTNDEGTPDDSKSLEGLSWSKEAQMVATGNVNGTVKLWDVATWRARSSFKLHDAVTGLRFIPGTKFLVAAGMDGSLGVWDVVTGERVWECLGHSAGVLGFAVQEGGHRLISAGDEGVCLVFNHTNSS